jgi:large subunit ribosomal protein L10
MSKAMRRRMVDELAGRYRALRNFVLVDYRGMNGRDTVDLRKQLRAAGIRLNVVKNSVAFHTFEQLGLKSLQDRLTGMNAVVTGPDPVEMAKRLLAFRDRDKQAKRPVIRGALVEGQVFGPEEVEALSKLPGRNELLATLLGTLQGVTQKFVSTLNEIPRKFLGTLQAISEKQEPPTKAEGQ